MSKLAIEIRDAGLLIAGEKGVLGAPVPGYALVEDGALAVGADAFHRARTSPRFVHHSFWERLATSPLGRPFPPELTHADLAHAHLAEAWRLARQETKGDVDGVVLVLPGVFSEEQLGLLLGIARACEVPVAGMVDLAVAAVAAARTAARRVLHLDLHLHRLVATEVAGGRELVRRVVDVLDGVGAVAFHDAWARRIAELFVRTTRFDPLHSATTEQALYSSLSTVLERLREEESAELYLAASGRALTTLVERGELEAAAGPLYDRILGLVRDAAAPGTALLLADGLAGLPGLADRLAASGDVTLAELPPGAAAAGALDAADAIGGGGAAMTFVTRLPSPVPPEASTAAPEAEPKVAGSPAAGSPAAARPARPATHLLHDGLAYAIGDEPFLLGSALPKSHRGLELAGTAAGVLASHLSVYRLAGRVVADRGGHETFLNGERLVGRRTLSAGDRLRLGSMPGVELQAIALVDDDGAP